MTAWLLALALVGNRETVLARPEPTGKWSVEYADDSCVLAHNFGEGDEAVSVGIQPVVNSQKFKLMVLSKRMGPREFTRGDALFQTDGMTAPVKLPYESYRLSTGEGRLYSVNVGDIGRDQRGTMTHMTFTVRGGPTVDVALPNMAAANRALEKCQDDLVKSWGLDPSMLDAATPAVPIHDRNWLTSDDYPAGAFLRGFQGETGIAWVIDAKGKVTDCRIIATSGVALLDKAACDAALNNIGNHEPALDKDGKPVPSIQTRRIIWKLP